MNLIKLLPIGLFLTFAASTCFATTLLPPRKVKCAVCGHKSYQTELMSMSSSGSPDLDLRPPEMERSTMYSWVQRCPECGYCNSSIKKKTSVDKAYLSSKKYKALFAKIKDNSLAASFIRQARIAEKDKLYKDAMLAYLHAAWRCDDEGNSQGAKKCRLLALKVLDANYKDIVKSFNEDTIACLKTDMLRRAGKFDEAIEFVQKQHSKTKQSFFTEILYFQFEKCKEKDANVYRVSDASRYQLDFPDDELAPEDKQIPEDEEEEDDFGYDDELTSEDEEAEEDD